MKSTSKLSSQTPKSVLKTKARPVSHSLTPAPNIQKFVRKKPQPETDDNIFSTVYDEKLKGYFQVIFLQSNFLSS